jgi:hypothetical protein
MYFDLKHLIGHGSYLAFTLLMGVSIAARSAILAATFWLAQDRPVPFLHVWGRAAEIVGFGALWFLPAAALFYMGSALRYAPFVLAAAALGVGVAVRTARRAAALKVDLEVSSASPSVGGLLTYGYLIALLGASMWALSGLGVWAVAFLVVLGAPLHALVLLGWRAEALGLAPAGGGRPIALVTALLVGSFLAASVFDRERGQPAGGLDAPRREGSLVLLGGADSTSRTGALAGFDARAVGFEREQVELLSYSAGRTYEISDTRAALPDVVPRFEEQIGDAEAPVHLLGHSQAALLLDLLPETGAAPLRAAVVIAGPPSEPPRLPEIDGPGAGAARAFAGALEGLGLASFDIDAPASPMRLPVTTAGPKGARRLAIWALGDSVWLDTDWRRSGETNIVVLSDHVGAVKNPHSVEAIRDVFQGQDVPGDEDSWRGLLADVVRFAFEPWRP